MVFRCFILVASIVFFGLNEAASQSIQTDISFNGLETVVVSNGTRNGGISATLRAKSIYGEEAGFITHSLNGPNGVSSSSRSPAAGPDLVIPGVGSIPISIFSTNTNAGPGAQSIEQVLDSLQGVWEFGVQPDGQPIQEARYEFQPPVAWGYTGLPQDFDIDFRIHQFASSSQNPEEILLSYEFSPTASTLFNSIEPNNKRLSLRIGGTAEDGQDISAIIPIASPTTGSLDLIAPFLTNDSEAITQLGRIDLTQPLDFVLAASITSDPFSSTKPDSPIDQVVTTLIAPNHINFTDATILSSYQNFIQGILVPEPSSAFVLICMAICHRRLRRFQP